MPAKTATAFVDIFEIPIVKMSIQGYHNLEFHIPWWDFDYNFEPTKRTKVRAAIPTF